MRHTSATLKSFVSAKNFVARGDAIEWEELPSLVPTLTERLVNDPARRRSVSRYDGVRGQVWDNTMPADLLAVTPTQPFSETLRGLDTREVHEPDVFRHFFGS